MKQSITFERQLATLRAELESCTCPDRKAELDEKIDFIQDEVDELEEAEQDAHDYDELMGNTSQDRYIDQNRHAIHQSEMYDRFRNEY